MVAQAAEAVDKRVPHAAGGGDVDAVAGIGVQVREVDVQAAQEVLHGHVLVPDLGGDHRLDDARQRRVARGDRVVVLEVGALLVRRELVTL